MRLNRLDTLDVSHYTVSYRVAQELVVRSDWTFEHY
jgi:hypothetical protein